MIFNTTEGNRITSLDQLPARLKRGFEAAKAASVCSDGYQVRDRMGTAIFAGSRLLAVGFNQFHKSRPGNKFIKVVDNKIVEFYRATHSEQAVLDRIKYSENYSNSKLILYIYRETADGMPSASAPCLMCQQVIKNSAVSIVRFFTMSGEYREWKV